MSVQRRAVLSWLSIGALFVLCAVLGVLQYRWIGEVSLAARDRLRASLQASLNRLSQELNSEITIACRALLPANPQPDTQAAEAEVAARFEQWKKAGRQGQLFHRLAIAAIEGEAVVLRALDPETGAFAATEWPAAWQGIHERLRMRLTPEGWQGRPPPTEHEGLLFEVPLMGRGRPGSRGVPFRPPGPFPRREAAWLIFDLNLQYVRDTILPELLQRHLGAGGAPDYQAVVLTNTSPPEIIYQSDPGEAKAVAANADASVGLFELRYDQIFRRGPRPGRGPGPPEMGRWHMFVRHRAGSLEAVVSRARWRNLAVTTGVLLLMVGSLAALIRFTRRAQKLAELQMEFVAGVSHELRTPLTVIHTAAYNLRGKVAANPAQVERYGALIQQESGRLKELVEQVLRFARAKAGHVIQDREPLSIEDVIDATMESSKALTSQCVVEKTIEAGLPPVLGDSIALKQALENLIGNAAKYGTGESNWIGIFAKKADGRDGPAVEIRVADRGPGIPLEEQKHIFDPFFRGRRAVQDQVHGTGLGLNLVKKIVEAHGGRIGVRSELNKGTEFIVRIPAAPPEHQHEFEDSLSRG